MYQVYLILHGFNSSTAAPNLPLVNAGCKYLGNVFYSTVSTIPSGDYAGVSVTDTVTSILSNASAGP
ncbi:MAG: hypothetical protein QOJ99_93 [Bryobacterales bacterium]|nr:hypothetical protein [Bryobacterales bacterium]